MFLFYKSEKEMAYTIGLLTSIIVIHESKSKRGPNEATPIVEVNLEARSSRESLNMNMN